MRPRPLHSAIALTTMMFVAGTGDAAPNVAPVRNARIVQQEVKRPLAVTDAAPAIPWAKDLPTIEVKNRNTNTIAKIRLYSDDGSIDKNELRSFMRAASSVANLVDKPSGEVAEPLDTRVVQLVFRAAYHFKSNSITIVSATRRGAHGKHGSGAAIDFQLSGVNANQLAAYVRAYPRAGVGIYTHPKTQYVHVDVRDHSYHWLDGSPPGVTWREKLLGDPSQQKRDASYASAMDLPEH